MNQYPDEDEEFELQYQDELELLEDVPHEYDAYDGPSTSRQAAAKQTKAVKDVSRFENSTLCSPQLSQITFGATQIENDDGGGGAGGGPVNRRLFGTPKGPPMGRGCSTPFQRMPAIQEMDATLPTSNGFKETEAVPLLNAAAQQLQELGTRGVNKRRLERDLFGDIDDLFHETYEDPLVKKARTEEQRDNEAIQRIVELRRKKQESTKTIRKDDVSRLKALLDFQRKNLSYEIPNWPFLPIQRSDLERIYVRFHSEEYEKRQLDLISARGAVVGSLLGDAKEKVWQEANELVLRRLAPDTQPAIAAPSTAVPETGRLWVDKYKPRKYIDLLSDEMTNRSLLYWLKMWDKVVFGKPFHSKQEQEAVTGGGPTGGGGGGGANTQLNSFNKRTGKFESNGGWRQRKARQALNTNVDAMGRPMQKVALLCGPPGLGKTTLAHTIARHAGYNVREINASDDRSPEAFKLALENGTQMSSVLNADKRPNCIVLDEIDGAPRQSIEYLVKFVNDDVHSKAKAKGAKFTQKSTTQRNIFQALRKGVTPSAVGVGHGRILLLDTVPMLKRILSPQLRSVTVKLLSPKELQDLNHTIEVMLDLGVTFVQVKSLEGHYVFQPEPDLDALIAFPGFPGLTVSYFGRQLLAREVALARIRRAAPKEGEPSAVAAASAKKQAAKTAATSHLPNHLQTLKPKPISASNVRSSAPKQQLTKDFFGRITHKTSTAKQIDEAKTDAIVKSPIWYRYKEGFNNAVRKDVHLHELL
ncbi:GL19453 [Drosophila persimilis]|uniref:GL19453 n=1 Tax=Drosophila persimilis TaxID=7234 RepID=B4G9C8_DROPE|nr:GL19453 [Drosophila persimilis]